MAYYLAHKIMISRGELVIESANTDDSEELISFIKQVDSESDFLMREENEFNMTIEEEKRFVSNILNSQKDLLLTAKLNGKIVGVSSLFCSKLSRYKHKGQLSISILKDYWGFNIGSNMIEQMLKWSQNNKINKISLEVDSVNERAIALYHKFGFISEGLLRKDKYLGNGVYRDLIIMARFHYDENVDNSNC